MILVKVPDAPRCFDGMKQRKVLVKSVARSPSPLLANCLRLTVGSPEENDLMIAALRESL
jgi:histidinol-phosphate aminotransferase